MENKYHQELCKCYKNHTLGKMCICKCHRPIYIHKKRLSKKKKAVFKAIHNLGDKSGK